MKFDDIVLTQAKSHKSFYLYKEATILEHINNLKTNINGVDFLYSVKANPNQNVLNTIFKNGLGADAASTREVILSKELGLSKDKIQYSAPGKHLEDISKTIELSILIADSISEIEMINDVAKDRGIIAEIGVRINPNFSMEGESGTPSKFGIDEDIAISMFDKWNAMENINIVGFHIHLQSQVLDTEKLKKYYINIFNIAIKLKKHLKNDLKFFNMGSGIGIPYNEADLPVKLDVLGNIINELKTKFAEELKSTTLYIETGRYVVCKSGFYITTVIDKKISYGKTFIILDNTLNGFLKPSLAQVIQRLSGQVSLKGAEPLFSGSNSHAITTSSSASELEQVTLCGNLCTANDMIAENIDIPMLKTGDLVAINNAGSYAATLSPTAFASLTPPAQLFLTKNNDILK